jgi:acyl-CoA synthetase (AMP-forming)/AMP-acid ligase II
MAAEGIDAVQTRIHQLLADKFAIAASSIRAGGGVAELGINSVEVSEFAHAIADEFRIDVRSSTIYESASIRELAATVHSMVARTEPMARRDVYQVEQTATQAIFDVVKRRSDEVVCSFHSYQKTGERVSHVKGRELYERSLRLAGQLVREPGGAGPVGVLCPQTPDYLVAMLACLAADRVAVPLFAPTNARTRPRLSAVLHDCGAQEVVTVDEFRAAVREVTAPGTRIVCADHEYDSWGPESFRADSGDTAYLQYTSGSTRNPAGVRVMHSNVVAGAWQLSSVFGMKADSRLVSWLPLYHDMGLMFVLTAILAGAPVHVMSPGDFVASPTRWLRVISDYRATHSVTPNSALDLCVLRVSEENKGSLDLRSLEVLVNGAEPVRMSSIRRFTERFSECGLSHVAHTPGYGLAEATLVVANSDPARPPHSMTVDRTALREGLVRENDDPAGSVELVSCGTPAMQSVSIVDPSARQPVAEDRTAEIWVKGPNVCDGYWGSPELSKQTFDATKIEGTDSDDGGWLRTGDVGFIHDGQLYVVDRLKDVIIIDGENHYASDIEANVIDHVPTVRRCAAFGVSFPDGDGAETLILSVEIGPKQDHAEVIKQIRRVVGSYHGIAVRDVRVARLGELPRTSSGKIMRKACAEQYLRIESEGRVMES